MISVVSRYVVIQAIKINRNYKPSSCIALFNILVLHFIDISYIISLCNDICSK